MLFKVLLMPFSTFVVIVMLLIAMKLMMLLLPLLMMLKMMMTLLLMLPFVAAFGFVAGDTIVFISLRICMSFVLTAVKQQALRLYCC